MQQVLWRAAEAREATAGALLGQDVWKAHGVSIDSRTVSVGDLFIALQGPNRDAHEFVPAAFENGASAAVVSSMLSSFEMSRSYLQVRDTFDALNELAKAARERNLGRRIAVSGSVGKTGTKEMLKLALGVHAKAHASTASYNNRWGVPLTLARMPADADYGIFEIGMSRAGEITPLTRFVSPHVAIITTVAPAHLEFFSSVEKIADAKGEIFEGLVPPAVAVLNGNSPYFKRLADRARYCGAETLLVFGPSSKADVRLSAVRRTADGSRVEADVCGEPITYKLSVYGDHWVVNSLAVLAAVHAVGANVRRAAAALVDMRAPKGRGQTHVIDVPDGTVSLIDESYNANPASMRAAIITLGTRAIEPRGRRIVVLGDMLELGERGPELHAELNQYLENADVDLIFLSGPLMEHLWRETDPAVRGEYGRTSSDLIEPVLSAMRAGDTLMVKGSLGSRMSVIVDAILGRVNVTPRLNDDARVRELS